MPPPTATPSSSSSPPPPKPTLAARALPGLASSLPTSWSHSETIHLIDAYREKWYSLNRGQLRAHQWEEVAKAVATRCGFHPPSKTATQCRHKIEKLRKRYRAEKQRGVASAAAWPYFHRMDLLEKGPAASAPAVAVACPAAAAAHPGHSSRASSSDENEDEDNKANTSNTRSLNHILQRPPLIDYSFPEFAKKPRFRKRSFYDRDEEEEEEEEEVEERGEAPGGGPMSELASVIRSFGEGFVRMEKMKMDMMRDSESNRMDMERRRTEMILESQMRIAEAIKTAIYSQKKARKSEEV